MVSEKAILHENFILFNLKLKLTNYPRNPKINDRSWPSVREQLENSHQILKSL